MIDIALNSYKIWGSFGFCFYCRPSHLRTYFHLFNVVSHSSVRFSSFFSLLQIEHLTPVSFFNQLLH